MNKKSDNIKLSIVRAHIKSIAPNIIFIYLVIQ